MTRWQIIIRDEKASTELAFLFEATQKAEDIKALLKLLADQDDPRHPSKDSG